MALASLVDLPHAAFAQLVECDIFTKNERLAFALINGSRLIWS